jgi:5' nucleotidase, deoxy (Pyrimidine), cytosolic type C protein (NT5C)
MAPDTRQIVLGVDLDGVCADFYGRMREVAAEWFERPIDELTEDVSYGLPGWGIKGGDQYESLHRFAVTAREHACPLVACGSSRSVPARGAFRRAWRAHSLGHPSLEGSTGPLTAESGTTPRGGQFAIWKIFL